MYFHQLPRWLIAVLVLALVMLLAGGIWLYRMHEQQLRQDVEANLLAIAQLKVSQIVTWRAERLADATVLQESGFFVEGVRRWLANAEFESTEREYILTRLRALQANYGYYDVLLVDSAGDVRLSLSGNLEPLYEETRAALRERRPILTDLRNGAGERPPHIDVIVPLHLPGEARTDEPVGAVILQSDASRFLYPLIQSWPVPSDSAETLLVRRDGDSVLYLNELRHQPGSALTLRIPLTQTEVPAVMAVLGREGIFQGKDYRGVNVLSVLLPVPDSPWFMVAKIDESEAYALWQSCAVLIQVLIFGLIVSLLGAGAVAWQRTQKAHYRSLFEAERARQEGEARYQATLLSIGDGVIVTDSQGRVELLNRVAESLTGWSQDEARGEPLDRVFSIINEDTRQPADNPAQRVMREGVVVGLAKHTLLLARDGREIPIADSGAPIRDGDGNLTGVVLVFRDQAKERAAQKALQESETFTRTVLDNLPIGVAVNTVEPSVSFSYMNDNFPRFYRTSREALVSPDTFWEAVYEDPGFRETIRQRVFEDVVSGDPARMRWEDIPITREGEETSYISAQNIPIPGKPYMVSTVWDITARKRAEEALKDGHRLLRAVIDNLPDRIYAKDRSGRFILKNMADARQMGARHPDETIGKTDFDYYPPELAAQYHADDQAVIESGQPLVNREERAIDVDGNERWILTTKVPLRDDSGTIIGLVGIGRDITDRKRAEEALQAERDSLEQRVIERTAELSHAKERVEAILNSNSDVTILCRTDGSISQVNPAFSRTLGIEAEEALRQPLTTMVAPEHAPVLKGALQSVVETRQPARLEVMIRPRGQAPFEADMVLSPIVEQPGRTLGVVGSLRNITEQKRREAELRQMLEQQMTLNEIKTRYLSMAAHDLRNPLAAIQTMVTVITEYGERLSEDQKRERYDRILAQVRYMVSLLDDILIIGQAESGKLRFDPEPLDIIAFCNDLVTEFAQGAISARNIVFTSQGDCGEVRADAKLLRHILGNLLSNALKYSADDSVVTFSLECGPDLLTFRIRDQGIGIPKAEQGRLFDTFFRASNVRKMPGTGLGLAIAKEAADLHGGAITFESEEGVGTTFIVILPRIPA